jgi:hypothetical protein
MTDLTSLSPFFESYAVERSVLFAMLSGQQSSRVWRDDRNVLLQNRAGECFMGGPAEGSEVLLKTLTGPLTRADSSWRMGGRWLIAVPPDDTWSEPLERAWGPQLTWIDRVAYLAGPGTAPSELPEGVSLEAVSPDNRESALQLNEDFLEPFDDFGHFLSTGYGILLRHRGEAASVMSTWCVGDGLAEVNVATSEAFRRRGYTRILGRAFFAETSRRGLRPSWSCHSSNLASNASARALGFVQGRPYRWALRDLGED